MDVYHPLTKIFDTMMHYYFHDINDKSFENKNIDLRIAETYL